MRLRPFLGIFEKQDLRLRKKAGILFNINAWTGLVALLLGIVLLLTHAVVASLFCFLMVGVTLGILALLRRGRLKAASNIFIFVLFAIMLGAIKFDAYVSAYETYVFAALGLVLLIVTSLINVGLWQLYAIAALDICGIALLWLADILPSYGYKIDTLQIQNLATSTILVILGSVAGIALIRLQDNLLIVTEEDRDRIGKMLSMTEVYTKKSLVSIIAQGMDPTKFLPEEKENAILFCDIRGFTGFSEKMKTLDIVAFLNSFFSRMNHIIQDHEGEIDKLIGDCIMASFSDRENAMRCSIEMQKILQIYNIERIEHHLSPIQIGIGISYGSVIVGNIGSISKMDFTLIGDIVNVSSRLEALTKIYGLDILTSIQPATTAHGSCNYRFIDSIKVKGKKNATEVFELFDHEPARIRDFKNGNQADYEKAYALYKNGEFSGAARLYDSLIQRAGPHTYRSNISLDPVLNYYKARCSDLIKAHSAGLLTEEDWKGVYTFIM